jgi:hypothetical protein
VGSYQNNPVVLIKDCLGHFRQGIGMLLRSPKKGVNNGIPGDKDPICGHSLLEKIITGQVCGSEVQ